MQYRYRILLLLASLVISLVTIELAARWVRVVRDQNKRVIGDPVLHHVWPPRNRAIGSNGQSWLKTYDVAFNKPGNTYRIFYLGDSNVEGAVAREHKMVEIVERELNNRWEKSGLKFEVINTGTGSYSFLLYYLLIKTKILRYAPDLVVVNIDMTDVFDDNFYRNFVVTDGTGEIVAIRPHYYHRYFMTPGGVVEVKAKSKLHQWLREHSAIGDLVDRLIFRLGYYGELKNLDDNKTANWLARVWTEDIEKNVTESMRVLRLTLRLLKRNGVKVFVTGVPHYPQYTGQWSDRPHRVLEQVASEEGTPYLNSYEKLKPLIARAELEKYYNRGDLRHFNIEGNRIWARAQLEFLLEESNGLLPFDRLKEGER